MLQIRGVLDSEAELVCSLVRQSFEELRSRLSPPSGAHELTAHAVLLNLRTGKGFLALWSDQPAGCVFCKQDEDSLYLFRLGVLPEFRRRGIAKSLIERVEEEAIGSRIPAVTLATRSSLIENIALYRSYGYGIDYETPHPKGSDMITVMRKHLPTELGTRSV